MADRHVRARCTATGHIAALPERALELGHIKNWVKAHGPVPDRPKPNVFPRTGATPEENADSESANLEEE